MTPRELLTLEPQRTSHDIAVALSHVPEADAWDIEPEEDDRIEIRIYAFVDFDGTRSWELGSIWFDEEPALIFQEAGRSRSDHYERWIVDPDVYWSLVKYSFELPRTDEAPHREDARGMDDEMGDVLTTFYGCALEQMRNYRRPGR
jgi:hypothetical protein